MTLTLNKNDYLKLLTEIKIIPKLIETETEYEEYLVVAEKLISKKNNRTLEETVLFRLIVRLIEDYEEKIYNIADWSNISSQEILKYLIESKGITEEDLAKILGSQQTVIDILQGRKNITEIEAKILGDYFQISPTLFLEN